VKNPVKMTVTRFSGTSLFAKLLLYGTDKSDNNLFQGTERKDTPHPEYGRTLYAIISSWSTGL